MGDLVEMPGRTKPKNSTDPLGILANAIDFVRDRENKVLAAIVVTIDEAGDPTFWRSDAASHTAMIGAVKILTTSLAITRLSNPEG